MEIRLLCVVDSIDGSIVRRDEGDVAFRLQFESSVQLAVFFVFAADENAKLTRGNEQCNVSECSANAYKVRDRIEERTIDLIRQMIAAKRHWRIAIIVEFDPLNKVWMFANCKSSAWFNDSGEIGNACCKKSNENLGARSTASYRWTRLALSFDLRQHRARPVE
jgi:hypothetical protein